MLRRSKFIIGLLFALSLSNASYAGKPTDVWGKLTSKGNITDFIKESVGHYEGTMTSHFGEKFAQQEVKSDIALTSGKNVSQVIAVNTEKNEPLITIAVMEAKKKMATITVSIAADQPIQLQKDDTCFSSVNSPKVVLLCFYPDGLSLEVTGDDQNQILSLTLSHFNAEKKLAPERPQSFTLKTAIDRAKNLNFDNRIEFEHVVQAKKSTKLAYRNLFPHLSFGTIVNNIQPTLLGIVGAAGDLLPFLFPTRWLQAKRAKLLGQAEKDSLILMRMDTACQIENLFYNYEFTRVVRDLYVTILKKAVVLRAEIYTREKKLGQYQEGATLNIDAVIQDMNQDYRAVITSLDEQRAGISQALGFFDPEAVSDVQLGEEIGVTIDKAEHLDRDAIQKVAEARSVEFRQIHYLIGAAQNNKKQTMFNWLDPSGDPSMGLGLGLKSAIDISESQGRELGVRLGQMHGILENKVYDAVKDYNLAIDTYSLAQKSVATEMQRFAQIVNFINLNGEVDLFGLNQILNDYFNDGVRLETSILSFRAARARIDRLQLTGVYSDLSRPMPNSTEKLNNQLYKGIQ